MKFHADHVIEGISLADYGNLYFEEDFNVKLCLAVRLGRELLEYRRDGNHIFRRTMVHPQDREIPSPVAKVLGQSHFSYVEELTMDLDTNQGSWRTIPTLLPDKVDTRGTLRFLDAGGNARRIVDGEIDVKVFGIGRIIEKFICADAEKSYAAAAEFARRYVAERG